MDTANFKKLVDEKNLFGIFIKYQPKSRVHLCNGEIGRIPNPSPSNFLHFLTNFTTHSPNYSVFLGTII